jgi:hypothetical protein
MARGRLHLPPVASHVTRSTCPADELGAFTATTLNAHRNMATMWHTENQRCRELAHPDIINFAVSMCANSNACHVSS